MSGAKRFSLNVKFEPMPETFSAKFRKDFPPYVIYIEFEIIQFLYSFH